MITAPAPAVGEAYPCLIRGHATDDSPPGQVIRPAVAPHFPPGLLPAPCSSRESIRKSP